MRADIEDDEILVAQMVLKSVGRHQRREGGGSGSRRKSANRIVASVAAKVLMWGSMAVSIN
ncbi:hypothetical protein [Breoghania sp.]|uniref:hypothetical protein n=1 Tax=Breoghania sp. TaxID=2065378 RepID=UPI002620B0CE|nr:hypothetical protein [Breoghania sp.]